MNSFSRAQGPPVSCREAAPMSRPHRADKSAGSPCPGGSGPPAAETCGWCTGMQTAGALGAGAGAGVVMCSSCAEQIFPQSLRASRWLGFPAP